MIPISPEMLLNMAKMVPAEKVNEARQAVINAVVAKETQAGSRLMAVLRLNEENTCMVAAIYTGDGRYLASWPVYDLDSLTALFTHVKNFDFTQKTLSPSHEQQPESTAAAGLPNASGSGTDSTAAPIPDESANGNGEYDQPATTGNK